MSDSTRMSEPDQEKNRLTPAEKTLGMLLATMWDPNLLPDPDTIPWDEVIELLIYSNLGALVYSLTRDIRQTLPPLVKDTLQYHFYKTFLKNSNYLHQIGRVKRALSQTGTPMILLKGGAIAIAHYNDPYLRLMGDIDLLIPYEFVYDCRESLLELGYTPGQVEHQPGNLVRHSNEEVFLPPIKDQCPVELHWHLLDASYYLHNLSMDWFWENTETLVISDEEYQVLNSEANLVYLPAHLALHHRFHSLHSLLDLALLIVQKQHEINWEKVIETAQKFELLSCHRATLNRLALSWPSLPIEIPQKMLLTRKPTKNDSRFYQLLTSKARSTTMDFYTNLVSLPDTPSRMRYAWVNLFPQPAYMIKRYGIKNRWQLPYWYIYRLIQGVHRICRMLPSAIKIDRLLERKDDNR